MPTPKFVIKRDGFKEIFNPKKIAVAINKAFVKGKVKADVNVVGDTVVSYNSEPVEIIRMVKEVVSKLVDETVSIETIQSKVVETLTENKFGPVASAYSNYMKHRDTVRNQHNITKDDYLSKKMLVMKKSGAEEEFSIAKIEAALSQGCEDVEGDDKLSVEEIKVIAEQVTRICAGLNRTIDTVEIRDIINKVLFDIKPALAKAMIEFGLKKSTNESSLIDKINALVSGNNEEMKQENSNKNPVIASTQRDYIAGIVSRELTVNSLLPKDVVEAHNEGVIHFHDADYFLETIFNCCLINLEDMFQNGTVISKTKIDKPHSFKTACNIATQIIAQVASNQYGGQSISLTHLAPFVNESRKKLRKDIEEGLVKTGIPYTQEQLDHFVELRLREEIKSGVQTIQYQVLTLMTCNGQSPFITVFCYLNEVKDEQLRADLAMVIEELFKQRIQGVKNEQGVWIAPTFPKIIYCLDETNCDETKPYWYLTELAAECTAKRMVPDYISEKMMLQLKKDKLGNGNCYTCMGCRSFLTPYVDEDGKPKYYGRFNQGVVTINLAYVGLLANKDMNKFWEELDKYLEICHRALQCRHERLEGTLSDVSPIHWQHGALARLKIGETIDKLLHNGYSTISLGFAGLWECVRALNGKKLTEPEGEELGLQIMKKLNEYTAKWKAAESIDYSLYGTPIETLVYKFAKANQKRFGIIEDVTDKTYLTNSYHVKITEDIDAFSKLALEAKFQALSPGGAISYVEVPNMQNNIPAVLEIIKFIYNTIMYAELNTKFDWCGECGYTGEIIIKEDEHGKLYWECPQCGNTDERTLTVVRRTCG